MNPCVIISRLPRSGQPQFQPLVMLIYLVYSTSARGRARIVVNDQFMCFLTLAEVSSTSVLTFGDAYFTRVQYFSLCYDLWYFSPLKFCVFLIVYLIGLQNFGR